MSRVRAKGFAGSVAVLVTAVSVASSAGAAAVERDARPESDQGVVVERIASIGRPAPLVRTVRAYWTPARMQHASTRHPSARLARYAPPEGVAEGASGIYPGTLPDSVAPGAAQLGRGGAGTEYYWPTDQYDAPPAITAGKLFLRWNGKDYVCSATAVNSPRRSLVWTAGHCVADQRRWATKMMFCPAYIDGSCPEGEWAVRKQFTTSSWFYKGNFSYDFGALLMVPRHGERIVDAVGGQGFAWGKPRSQSWTVLGYPAARPFDGQRLYACEDATKRFLDPPRPGPDQTGVDCGMTAGSSGGGWLIALDGDGLGLVNGIVSLGIDATDEIFSPYHGRVARRLWRRAGS